MKTPYQFWKNFESLSPWRKGMFLFLLAFFVRLAIIVIVHPYRDLERYELERTAISLAINGIYGNPYAIATGPTAHVSPGYTVILAGIFRLFGTSIPAEIIKELLASLVTALQCAILPFVAEKMLIGQRAGLIAGVLCALLPIKPFVQIDGDWEAPYTALFLMLTLAASVQTWKTCKLTIASAIRNGCLWGAALLFASVLLPIFCLTLITGAYFCRRMGYKPYLTFAGVQVVLVIALLSPWIIRNQRTLGAPIATRSNLGIELRVSNNDQATPDQRVNYLLGVYDRYHPLQNAGEALKVRKLGEVAYNKQAQEDAKNWIRRNPGRFLQLCMGRFYCFWFYPDPSRIKALFGDLTTILGLAGFVVVMRKEPIAGAAIGIVLLLYPAPNYLIHVGARQRYPIDWLLTLLSVVFVIVSTRWLYNRNRKREREMAA